MEEEERGSLRFGHGEELGLEKREGSSEAGVVRSVSNVEVGLRVWLRP